MGWDSMKCVVNEMLEFFLRTKDYHFTFPKKFTFKVKKMSVFKENGCIIPYVETTNTQTYRMFTLGPQALPLRSSNMGWIRNRTLFSFLPTEQSSGGLHSPPALGGKHLQTSFCLSGLLCRVPAHHKPCAQISSDLQ